MDIKAISTISLPAAATAAQNTNTPKPQEATNSQSVPNQAEKKHSSKLPYVAGTIVLAGLGAYLGRNQIAKLFKEKEVIKKEIVKEVKKELKHPPHTPKFANIIERKKGPEFKMPAKEQPIVAKAEEIIEKVEEKAVENVEKAVAKKLKHPPYSPEFLNAKNVSKEPVFKLPKKEQSLVSKSPVVIEQPASLKLKKDNVKKVVVGFDENKKPVYEEIRTYAPEELALIGDAHHSVRSKLNLNSKEVLAKILENKKSQANEINRIIGENIQNEHVNLPIMQKVARDFASDNAGRGENRFHQAADIMEQALIKEFVKGDAKQKEGLQSFFDVAKGDSPLFEIYAHMPIDEAATRLRYLADNDLKSASYKGIDAEAFFEKSLQRLVEKFQFKKYNEAHNIKSAF